MFGRGARLLEEVSKLRLPAQLGPRSNRDLMEYRGKLRQLRDEIARFVSARLDGVLRKSLAIVGAAGTLAGGLDWIWQAFGNAGYLSQTADA